MVTIVAAAGLLGQQDAGVHRLAVEQHRADAAFGLEAILLGAGHAELAAQHVQQRPVRLDQQLMALAVDRELERLARHAAGLSMRWTQAASARSTSAATRSLR